MCPSHFDVLCYSANQLRDAQATIEELNDALKIAKLNERVADNLHLQAMAEIAPLKKEIIQKCSLYEVKIQELKRQFLEEKHKATQLQFQVEGQASQSVKYFNLPNHILER